MIHAAWWLAPERIQILGWTLLHFVWQGAALALLLYVVMAFCRSALTRYVCALSGLIVMAACPAATFTFLEHRSDAEIAPSLVHTVAGNIQALAGSSAALHFESAVTPAASADWLRWCVAAWFAGVLIFGMRALGGWILIERLRREQIEPLAETVRERCIVLQQRLPVLQRVAYFQSRLADAPAVIGWFRPMILLPVTALTGLSPQQLEAVIAHELAHIKRFDCFVNLFQIAVEALLFYHPAIWWVSHRIRVERENCCDDMAVSLCGNPGAYARALALIESWRAAPALVMAATGGSLKARISRLIGFENISAGVSRAGLATLGLLCAAGAVIAGSAFHTAFFDAPDLDSTPAQALSAVTAPSRPAPPQVFSSNTEPVPAPVAPEHRWPKADTATVAPAAETIAAPEIAQQNAPPEPPSAPSEPSSAPEPPSAPPPPPGSYIGDLHSAGLPNLTVDQLIALKIQGVTADYVRRMRDAGLNPTVDKLIAMKVQGISPEYVREMRAAGVNPSLDQLIALKIQGVSPEYVRKVREGWSDATTDQIIALRVQGVNPTAAGEYRRLGLKDLTLDRMIALRVQGVTPEYIRSMQAAGLGNLSTDDYIAARIQGITPEFVAKVRSHGFTNLTLHQLLALKFAGVF